MDRITSQKSELLKKRSATHPLKDAMPARARVERPLAGKRAHGLARKSSREITSKYSHPFGLGFLIRNYHSRHQRINNVYLGIKDEKDIAREFADMKSKVQDRIIALRNIDTGEVVNVQNGSRWNTKSSYFIKLRIKLYKQVEGLKYARMLTLSFDPSLLQTHIPEWWIYNLQEFLIVFGNIYVTRFLKRFRMYWERLGNKWHYILCVSEIQPGTGNVHFHLIFRGSYIGDAKTLMNFWEGSSQPAGLEISKKKNSRGAVSYIARYIGKLEDLTTGNKWGHLQKFMWYFRVRQYNIRHKINRNKNIKENEGKWKLVSNSRSERLWQEFKEIMPVDKKALRKARKKYWAEVVSQYSSKTDKD